MVCMSQIDSLLALVIIQKQKVWVTVLLPDLSHDQIDLCWWFLIWVKTTTSTSIDCNAVGAVETIGKNIHSVDTRACIQCKFYSKLSFTLIVLPHA